MLKQRILIVDDDREVVRLMQAYLERAGYDVMVAYDGETAVHMLRRDKPDLLLLDLMLPDRDGFDITRLMRSDPSLADIPIIMLTARVDVTDRIVGLEMGADDYITKPYDPREVVARVRARLRSPGPSPPQIFEAGDLQLDIGRREVRVGDDLVDLTPTEFNLLRVLMSQAGYVLTRSELISRGLGANYEGIERTLDSHIRNLRQKIEPEPEKVKYIHTIYGVGYRLEEIKQ
ncbi:MAG: response regulator transcription factor [Chloroflexota bacterium]|jgi:two-component system alkaline phosphatase synthesis response regulator PhoP